MKISGLASLIVHSLIYFSLFLARPITIFLSACLFYDLITAILPKASFENSRNLLSGREEPDSHSDKDIKFPDKKDKTCGSPKTTLLSKLEEQLQETCAAMILGLFKMEVVLVENKGA